MSGFNEICHLQTASLPAKYLRAFLQRPLLHLPTAFGYFLLAITIHYGQGVYYCLKTLPDTVGELQSVIFQ
jgi:hypothetical protein